MGEDEKIAIFSRWVATPSGLPLMNCATLLISMGAVSARNAAAACQAISVLRQPT
jgi:hypothetical protein